MPSNPWDVMRELATMQERMNRIWGSAFDRGHEDVTSRGWAPPVDIYETEGREVVLKAELPGLRREDINLTVENSTLTIRGERRRDESIKDDRYHRIEREYGAFARSFTLPNSVDAGRVRADYRDGLLTIVLPLRDEAQSRQIQVEVGD
jgi:HSP20 family protein